MSFFPFFSLSFKEGSNRNLLVPSPNTFPSAGSGSLISFTELRGTQWRLLVLITTRMLGSWHYCLFFLMKTQQPREVRFFCQGHTANKRDSHPSPLRQGHGSLHHSLSISSNQHCLRPSCMADLVLKDQVKEVFLFCLDSSHVHHSPWILLLLWSNEEW